MALPQVTQRPPTCSNVPPLHALFGFISGTMHSRLASPHGHSLPVRGASPRALALWEQGVIVILDEVVDLDVMAIQLPCRRPPGSMQSRTIYHVRAQQREPLCRLRVYNICVCAPGRGARRNCTKRAPLALYVPIMSAAAHKVPGCLHLLHDLGICQSTAKQKGRVSW